MKMKPARRLSAYTKPLTPHEEYKTMSDSNEVNWDSSLWQEINIDPFVRITKDKPDQTT